MFQKRKKFKEEITVEGRLLERWDQQVFFIKRKFPHSSTAIDAIMRNHASKQGSVFAPSEDALVDLANLSVALRDAAYSA
jgi:hypothetical protein